MLPSLNLPPDYTARPATIDDAETVAELENIYERELTGLPSVTAEEVRSDLSQPSLQLERDSLLVFAPDGLLTGGAFFFSGSPHVNGFIFAEVHPAHRCRGIGTALCGWAEARGREDLRLAPEGARVVLRQFKMQADEPARRLLTALGWHVARHNLRMVIELSEPPPEPAVPQGLAIRSLVRGQDERAAAMAVREAFADHWGVVPGDFEEFLREWSHALDTSPSADPSLMFLAIDTSSGEVAGTAYCNASNAEDPELGWIYDLGVRRPWRRRGLGLALLHHCFGALYRRGKRRVALGVDSDSLTGATRLYARAGMSVARQYDFYEKELRAGTDLSRREAP